MTKRGTSSPENLVKTAQELLHPANIRIVDIYQVSGNDEMKIECLTALGRMGDPASLDILMGGIEQLPENVEPFSALGHYKNPESVPHLLKLLEHPDIEFKEEIVRVLGEMGDPRALPMLDELLHDQDRMVRYNAAWALYKIHNRDVAQTVSRLLSDPDEWIVINVLEILSRLKDAQVIPVLVGQFKIVRDPRLKAIIISSLGVFGEAQLLPIFEEGLKSFDPRIQANAVEAIALLKLSDAETKKRLKKFLTHPNNRVKANAAIALYSCDGERVIQELKSMAKSKEVPVRRSAGYVLSKIQIPAREGFLEDLLSDPAFSVRKMALKATVKLPTKISPVRYLVFFKDDNPWVRKEAVECARKITEFPSESLLDAFKSEKNPVVLESMLEYFTDRSYNDAIGPIIQKIKEKPEEELSRLVLALGRLHSRDVITDTKKWLDSTNTDAWREYFIARLLQGDLGPIKELCTILKEKTREDELMIWTKVAGEVGSFLREPKRFSPALIASLAQEGNLTLTEAAPPKPVEKPLPESSIEEGMRLYENGQMDEAFDFMRKYLQNFPEHHDALYYLAAILFKRGEVDSALPILKRLWTMAPEHAQGSLLLGQIFFYKKEWTTLIEVYTTLLEKVPDLEEKYLSQVLGAMGVAQFHLKHFGKAIKVLGKAREINPRDLSSHYHLALAHYAMKNHKTSLQLLKELRKTLPSDSRVLRNVEDLMQKLEEEG